MSWVCLWWFVLSLTAWYRRGRTEHRLELLNRFNFCFSFPWSTFSADDKRGAQNSFCGDLLWPFLSPCSYRTNNNMVQCESWSGGETPTGFGPSSALRFRKNEMDVNVIAICRKIWLCSVFCSVCTSSLFVVPWSMMAGGGVFSWTLGPQPAAKAAQTSFFILFFSFCDVKAMLTCAIDLLATYEIQTIRSVLSDSSRPFGSCQYSCEMFGLWGWMNGRTNRRTVVRCLVRLVTL